MLLRSLRLSWFDSYLVKLMMLMYWYLNWRYAENVRIMHLCLNNNRKNLQELTIFKPILNDMYSTFQRESVNLGYSVLWQDCKRKFERQYSSSHPNECPLSSAVLVLCESPVVDSSLAEHGIFLTCLIGWIIEWHSSCTSYWTLASNV